MCSSALALCCLQVYVPAAVCAFLPLPVTPQHALPSFLATCGALLPASSASNACGRAIQIAITSRTDPKPPNPSALAATGFLSSDEVGEAVTALPTVSSAETRIAVAALGEAEGAADASSNPLAANVRLLAVCMRGLPDMLTGACSYHKSNFWQVQLNSLITAHIRCHDVCILL